MKRAVIAAVLAVALATPATAHAHSPRYLVSLGDSLAVGVQPGVGETDRGYVDQLLGILRAGDRRWTAVKFGCGGESTTSMLKGSLLPPASSCGPPDFYRARYPQGTQLASAVAFIRSHRGQIGLVTVNAGSNNLGECFVSASAACVAARLPAVQSELTEILRTLRRAGAPLIVGMTYYDPFLGAWLAGPDGQAFARASNDNVLALNAVLERSYRGAGARVADVARAFRITDFSTHGGELPRNVTLACRWSWFCSPPPGPDIHPNDAGYAVMAHAFADQLRGTR